MKQILFKNYEELACDIADTFDNINDKYGEVSIIAKYEEAKEIIKCLLCTGYDLASIELYRDDLENYYDEYIIGLNFDGVWCEKFKRDKGYYTDESNVIYIMDNCSSQVISYCKSKNVYEVSVGDQDEEEYNDEISKTEHSYRVNGKPVDKETFKRYVSKFAPDLVDDEEYLSSDDNCSISVKRNSQEDNVLEIFKDMEHRMMHMNEMLCEMDNFRQLFNW